MEKRFIVIVNDEDVADILVRRGHPTTYWGEPWKALLEKAKEFASFQGDIYIIATAEELRPILYVLRDLPKNVALLVPSTQDISVGRLFTKSGPISFLPDIFGCTFWCIRRGTARLADFLLPKE